MEIEVNGTRLWFDVDGPGLVADGSTMRHRPTVVLLHGGPASYDHSYFKPDFGSLTDVAQVVYLDLRSHGRSARHDPADWTFEACADDVAAFCEALSIVRPIVLGHSAGGLVAIAYGARHAEQAGGLVLWSTMARLDLERLAGGFRRAAGDEVAEIARRAFDGREVTTDEWARAFAVFGPNRPAAEQLARRIRNVELGPPSLDRMRAINLVDELPKIDCPTLILVGEVEPGTPVAASEEIAAGLRPGIGRLEIVPGAGHFGWLDRPEVFWPLVTGWITETWTSAADRPSVGA